MIVIEKKISPDMVDKAVKLFEGSTCPFFKRVALLKYSSFSI